MPLFSHPSLIGVIPGPAEYVIRNLTRAVEDVHSRLGHVPDNVLTEDEARRLYAAGVVKGELQAGGDNPINVTNLLGVLAQPQYSYVPAVTVLPGQSDPLSQDGLLVMYQQTLYRFDGSTEPGVWRPVGSAVISDTHANRVNYPAGNYALGMLYWETDRTVLYKNTDVAGVNTWVYMLGEMSGVQASVAGLGLGTADAGFLYEVTNYRHTLKWSGSAWGWGPGDEGSGKMQMFEVDPNPSTGWALYDGGSHSYLKADGTLGSVTLPDLATPTYVKAGKTANSGPNSPVRPTLNGTSGLAGTGAITGTTDTAADHVHAVALSSTTPNYPAGLLGTDVGGGFVFLANDTHFHDVVGDTGPGGAHSHTISGASVLPHDHGVGSYLITDDGEPENYVRKTWFRC